MKKCLLLATDWEPDYWEKEKKAPYRKRKYTDLVEWNELSENCPLPGIGIYTKGEKQDLSRVLFMYLEIKNMEYDYNTLEPLFHFRPIKKSKTESYKLVNELPRNNKTSHDQPKLFSAINSEELLKILKEIGEAPPEEWIKLIEEEKHIISWEDWIGKYFLELKRGHLSNNEFEDRVADLLKALGFDVIQKGHKTPGEYPDGIFSFDDDDDYTIVYDCKNIDDFYPTTEDERAIKKYWNDEKIARKGENVYCAFIAKSFRERSRGDIFYLSIESLLYLLYTKLLVGSRFSLSPLKKIFHNFISLEKDTIEKEWKT